MLIVRSLRFAAVGLVNTAAGLSVIWSLMYLGLNPWLSNACGYAAGLSISYMLNRIWTFEARAQPHRPIRFLLSFAVAYAFNIAVLSLLITATDTNLYLAQVFASATYTMTFFALCHWIVFADTPDGRTG